MGEEFRKVKILDISYHNDSNLFNVLIKDIETGKKTTLSWKGTDLGVTPSVPENIIDDFCKKMIGQEKNLIIQKEKIDLNASNLKNASEEQLKQFDDAFNKYPVKEIAKSMNKDARENGQ